MDTNISTNTESCISNIIENIDTYLKSNDIKLSKKDEIIFHQYKNSYIFSQAIYAHLLNISKSCNKNFLDFLDDLSKKNMNEILNNFK